jgi:hypothetical protein
MNKKILVMLILSILMMVCFLIVGLILKTTTGYVHEFTASQTESAIEEQQILDDVSQRTGLRPDWRAIKTYIYCYLLEPGRPRAEVEKGLSKIGEYVSSHEMDLYQIDFKNNFLYENLSPIKILFKDDFVVTSGENELYWDADVECDLNQARVRPILIKEASVVVSTSS